MGWTKRQFIDAAFDEIGMATYTFEFYFYTVQVDPITLFNLDGTKANPVLHTKPFITTFAHKADSYMIEIGKLR